MKQIKSTLVYTLLFIMAACKPATAGGNTRYNEALYKKHGIRVNNDIITSQLKRRHNVSCVNGFRINNSVSYEDYIFVLATVNVPKNSKDCVKMQKKYRVGEPRVTPPYHDASSDDLLIYSVKMEKFIYYDDDTDDYDWYKFPNTHAVVDGVIYFIEYGTLTSYRIEESALMKSRYALKNESITCGYSTGFDSDGNVHLLVFENENHDAVCDGYHGSINKLPVSEFEQVENIRPEN